MNIPKLFIGFKSSDIQHVRSIFYALKYQGLDIWDYSQQGDEIPAGSIIGEFLKRKIDQSDYVIVLISKESSRGHYTALEVKFALELKKKIIPILLDSAEGINWKGHYQLIRDTLFLDLKNQTLDYIVKRICSVIGKSYISPLKEYVRLPVLQKLSQELLPYKNVNNAAYLNLFDIAEDISNAYINEDYFTVRDYLTCFDIYCKKYNIDIYYALVLKGVVEMHLGFWAEAEEIFKKATKHPKLDSNAFSVLAHLYLKQERIDEAIEMFEKAYRICEGKYKNMMKFNIELCRFKLGLEISDTSFFDKIDYSLLIDDDYARIMSFKANLAYKNNQKDIALDIWEEMDKKSIHDEDSVYYWAMTLIEISETEKGIALLKKYAQKLNSINLYHHLIQQYFNNKEYYLETALLTIEMLIKNEQAERKFYFEFIRGLIAAGKQEKANDICNEMLQTSNLPKTSEDFFIDGFANYVLKQEDRAKYDFQRAKLDLPFYNEYLPKNYINN